MTGHRPFPPPKTIEEMKEKGQMPIALGPVQELGKPGVHRVELIPSKTVTSDAMRQFDTGATRHTDEGKLDFEGFLSPHVLKRYAEYLDEHRIQADGKVRASDNWQQGIPLEVYMKSALRHTMDWWGLHREQTYDTHPETQKAHEDAICAVMFNAMGYLFEILQYKDKCSERDGGAPPREALEETAYDE